MKIEFIIILVVIAGIIAVVFCIKFCIRDNYKKIAKDEKAETVNEWENKDKYREDRQDKKRQDRGQKIKDFVKKLFKKGV